MPDKFLYHLIPDQGVTGNFEVFVYKQADLSDTPNQIYSKKKSGKFPFKDENEWKQFMEALTAASA